MKFTEQEYIEARNRALGFPGCRDDEKINEIVSSNAFRERFGVELFSGIYIGNSRPDGFDPFSQRIIEHKFSEELKINGRGTYSSIQTREHLEKYKRDKPISIHSAYHNNTIQYIARFDPWHPKCELLPNFELTINEREYHNYKTALKCSSYKQWIKADPDIILFPCADLSLWTPNFARAVRYHPNTIMYDGPSRKKIVWSPMFYANEPMSFANIK